MSYIETRLRELLDTLTDQHRDMVGKLIEQQDAHFERLERLLKILVGRRNLDELCDIPTSNERAMPECEISHEADASVAIPTERDPIYDPSTRVSPLLFGSEMSRQLTSELITPPFYDNPELRTSVRKSILASAHQSVDDLSDDDVRAQNRLATIELGDARSVWHKLLPRGSRRLEALRLSVKSGSILQRLKSNRSYEVFMLLAIISNSLYIGFKTEYAAQIFPSTSENCYQCEGSGLAFYWVDAVYTFIFFVEWILRVWVDKWAFFNACSPEFGWNAFDTFVLAMMLMDEVSVYIIPGGVNASQLSMLRLLRMVRIFRAFRLVRVLKFLRELRIVMNTVVSALRSLVWTFCVIFMMLYVFAIVMTQGTVEYCLLEDACTGDSAKGLRNHFGTISRSGLTLFMSMSNGNQWEDVFHYLGVLNPIYPIAFVVYVCLALFALLNIVNGVFVETTLNAAKLDDVAVIEEEIRVREKYLERLHGIFNSLDVNKDGVLSCAEFELAFKDERVVALFNAAGIDPDNSRILFNLIDKDLDGCVSMDDFWRGCMRLRGAAKALELCQLQIDIDWLCKNVRVVRNLLIDMAEERAAEFLTVQSDRRSVSKRSSFVGTEVGDRRSVSKRSNYFATELNLNRRSQSKRSNI